MATYSGISASLTRTRQSLERLGQSAAKTHRRLRMLRQSVTEIRSELKTGRGQKIRATLSRNLRSAETALTELEYIEIRAERIRFKVRNLELDVTFGTPTYELVARPRLLKQTELLIRDLEKLVMQLKPSRKELLELRQELKQASIRAEWHYKVDHCVDLFRAGYDELGLETLLLLCYGPDTPPDPRRRALNELLSWGHTCGDQQIIDLAMNHLGSYSLASEKGAASERELVLRLEAVRSQQGLETSESFLLLQDAARRATEDSLLAMANLFVGFALDRAPNIGVVLQLAWINKSFSVQKLEPITIDFSADSLFDSVDCDIDPGSFVENGELVTVIVPAWNSESWLATAVRGLVKQSWRNLEIIIVDDCSSDGTLDLAHRLSATDRRIKVLANPVNRGAYASRNYALSVSRGEFITVHDADDWSHPRKIERQMLHLQRNGNLVANLSHSVRINPDNLTFFAQYGREIVRQNSSSLLFRRSPVFEQLGYWDEVKFGADTEFHHRIRAKFGSETAPLAKLGNLSLTRYHSESLTGGGKYSTQRGIIGARRDYLGKFEAWHRTIREDELASLFMERATDKRPFPIPTSSSVDASNLSKFELVVVANLSIETPWLSDCYAAVRKLHAQGKQVAFMHLPGLERPTQSIGTEFEQLVTDKVARRIYAENSAVAQKVVVQGSTLRATNTLMPSIKAKKVDVVLDNEEILVDLIGAVALAHQSFGVKPMLFGANRATKARVQTVKNDTPVAAKVWKIG